MRTSDLLLTENLMDLRQRELRRAALACRRRDCTGVTIQAPSRLHGFVVDLAAWLRQIGSSAELDGDSACLNGGIGARPARS